VFAGVKLTLQKVLDLTEPMILRRLGVTRELLTHEDWRAIQDAGGESRTQVIGRAAFHAGFEGLIVPSARWETGNNVVIFPDKLLRNSSIEPNSPDELPPHPSEWPE
jgi:RES domain-containing protein